MRAAVPALNATLLAGYAAACAAPAASRFPAGRLLFPAIAAVPTEGRAMALPFEDWMESFPELLEEAGARATFLVAGEQLERARGERPSGLCP
ncbi:MAG: hypothetical protein M3317_07210 [Actinomycetota bacterium]|nr:hypothetical protein [Actinomycetota bacterium]